MPTYRLTVAYDGAPFHGFARQKDVVTVQETLEDALSRILGAPVGTSAAGRTDAGVHALGQVVSFETETDVSPDDILRRLNALCGPSIAIQEAVGVRDGFNARHSAIARTYEYGILTRQVHDPFSRHSTWHHPGHLDVEAMAKAAQALLGEHDFSSFGRVENGQNPVRRVEEIEVEERDDLVVVRIRANSFIQQMVRSIVGTLVKVGEGRMGPEEMDVILHARDRSKAGPVAPPQGLFLASVSYPEEAL